MIFSLSKAWFYALFLLSTVFASAPQANDARLHEFLTINDQTSVSELSQTTMQLEQQFRQHKDDRAAKMFFGYGQLFMAADFLTKKNYMRAAELAKLGFFYIDEAAETDPNDWRMRFLRARMDAFVPAANGRCAIALKDTAYLQENKDRQVPASLTPFITLMSARAMAACQRSQEAEAALQALNADAQGKKLAVWIDRKGGPPWTAAEMTEVIQPLAEVTP